MVDRTGPQIKPDQTTQATSSSSRPNGEQSPNMTELEPGLWLSVGTYRRNRPLKVCKFVSL